MDAKEYRGIRHFYEWRIEQPDLKCTRESQKFSLKCVSWYFKLSATLNCRGEEVWDLCMVYDSEPNIMWNVTTYVQDTKGKLEMICSSDYTHIYNDINQDNKCPNLITYLDSVKLQKNKHKYLHNHKFRFVIVLDEMLKNLFDVRINTLGDPHDDNHNLQQLSFSMMKMYENGELSDVEIKCGEKLFFAHRNILATRSVVFAEMLRNKVTGNFTRKICIKDVRCDILEKFLIFLYSGKIEFESVSTACELYEQAAKYDVFLLKQRCFYFLKDNIAINNYSQILLFADKNHNKDLIEYVVEFMMNDETFLKSEEWFEFVKENPHLAETMKEVRNIWKAIPLVNIEDSSNES